MRVHWQEVAMVVAIVCIFASVSQIQQIGLWPSLLAGLPLGLLAGAAYWLLMPWVIRWAARGQKENPLPGGKEAQDSRANGESDARP